MEKMKELIDKILFKRFTFYVKQHHSEKIEGANLKDKQLTSLISNLRTEIREQVDSIWDSMQRDMETSDWFIDSWIDDILYKYEDQNELEVEAKIDGEDSVWVDVDGEEEVYPQVKCPSAVNDKECNECFHSQPHDYDKSCETKCGKTQTTCKEHSEELEEVKATGGL